MKLALVFDDLIQHGGAERLLLAAHEVWPDAPVYTTVATKQWQDLCKKKGITLKTSFLQKFPFKIAFHRVYAALFFHIFALRRFDFSDFDVVLSMSSRFAHLIRVNKPTKHISYINSPGRMYWEPHFYFKTEKFGKTLLKVLNIPLSLTRVFDYINVQKVDYLIANSKTPQQRIKKYYKKDAKIIYPFSDINTPKSTSLTKSKNYFLIMTRLVPWKRVDIAIKACKKADLNLKIIGKGPALKELQKLTDNSPNIEFLGYVSEDKKEKLLAECKALIVTQKEDFGISLLEAMAFGKPVIAYKRGGALETIVDGLSGVFFEPQNEEVLMNALELFDSKMFDFSKIIKHANAFTKENFKEKLKNYVGSVYLGSKA